MKAFVLVAFALVALCYAEDPQTLQSGKVTHVVIPQGVKTVWYKWDHAVFGAAHAEVCFGTVRMYQNSVQELPDKPYATITPAAPLANWTIKANQYIAFSVDEIKNNGPNGINGALDLAVSTDYAEVVAMIPVTFDENVDINLNMNSKLATLTWQSTGVDRTSVYRKDYEKKEYTPETDFPPAGFAETGCSAKLWMERDNEASDAITISCPNVCEAAVKVKDITNKKVTIVAITTEKTDKDSIVSSYKFIELGAASTTVVSFAALFLLLASLLF